MKANSLTGILPIVILFIVLALVTLIAGLKISHAEDIAMSQLDASSPSDIVPGALDLSTIIIDNATFGYYNTSLELLLDETDSERFPPANTFYGSSIVFDTAPDLAVVGEILGGWLDSPLPGLNDNWSTLQSIPTTWQVNTEDAIVYEIDAGGGVSNLLATFYVDNGIHIWVNGDFRYGARDPLGKWYYNILLGDLEPGINHIQVLREDSGGYTGYSMEIVGTSAPLPGTSCVLSSIDDEANVFEVVIRNQQIGLSDISVSSTNANVEIPEFEYGYTEPVTAVIFKTDAMANAVVDFTIEDSNSEQVPCDWADVIKQGSEELSFEGIKPSQYLLALHNGAPGFKKLQLTVGGTVLSLDRLTDNLQMEVDISQLLTAEENLVQVRGFGPPGSSATLLIQSKEVESM